MAESKMSWKLIDEEVGLYACEIHRTFRGVVDPVPTGCLTMIADVTAEDIRAGYFTGSGATRPRGGVGRTSTFIPDVTIECLKLSIRFAKTG